MGADIAVAAVLAVVLALAGVLVVWDRRAARRERRREGGGHG